MKLAWDKIVRLAMRWRPAVRLHEPQLHPAQAAAVAGAADAAAQVSSLAALLGSHMVRDGELVLLILKPSFWFIVFDSAYFAALATVLAILAWMLNQHAHGHFYFEVALFCIMGRLMWAVLQWMGRLYILTDLRVLRITGVFGVDIFDCPLRKVARTRLISLQREKVVGVGSIEIIPSDETMLAAVWQTIARPVEIQQRLAAAINRAKQTGTGCEK